MKGEWKTINGAKIFIEDGESVEKAFEEQKELNKRYSSDDVKTDMKDIDSEKDFEKGLTNDNKSCKLQFFPKTSGFKNRNDRNRHRKHVKEMGFNNIEDYEKAGITFANSDKGVMHQIGNKFYRFDECTAELVVVGKDTNLVSYFKPQNGDLVKAKKYYFNFIDNSGGKRL